MSNNAKEDQDRFYDEKLMKMVLEKVFWTKEKLDTVRSKMLLCKDKILKKTKSDFDELKEMIINGEKDKVVERLYDPWFKRFYKLNILKSDFLDFMIKCDQTELLL